MKVFTVLSSLLVASLADDYCLCGQENTARRILDGKEAQKGRYPWMAKVDTDKGGCGGSIINDRYILTAAHCFSATPNPETTFVRIGMHSTDERIEPLKVEKVMVHELFRTNKPVNTYSDIALVKLAKPLQFDGTLNPVCLSSLEPSKDFFLTGWGYIREGDKLAHSDKLQEGVITFHNQTYCKSRWYASFDEKTQFCAGTTINACMGDSGGPLCERTNGHVYQMGVVSWGVGDCNVKAVAANATMDKMWPGVYTKISAFKQWLGERMPDAKWCRPGAHNLLFP